MTADPQDKAPSNDIAQAFSKSQRRKPKTIRQKIRNFIWPAMGWKRAVRYYRHRIGRLPGSAAHIAAGFAVGIAVSFTPFIGFHLLLGALIAWIMGGSLIAMALGTVMGGNPWTFIPIWFGTYRLGMWMLGRSPHRDPAFQTDAALNLTTLIHKPFDLLLPMAMGSAPPAILFGFISYYVMRRLVTRYKTKYVRDVKFRIKEMR